MLFCGDHPRTSTAVFFSMMWGLGAGGVFTRCFGLRPREGPMAGPLGNAPRGGLGGRKRGEGGRGRADGNEGGHSGSRICLVFTGLIKVCQILDWQCRNALSCLKP